MGQMLSPRRRTPRLSDTDFHDHQWLLSDQLDVARRVAAVRPDRAHLLAQCCRIWGRRHPSAPYEPLSYCRQGRLCRSCSEIDAQKLGKIYDNVVKLVAGSKKILCIVFSLPEPGSEAEVVEQLRLCDEAQKELLHWRRNQRRAWKRLPRAEARKRELGVPLCAIHCRFALEYAANWHPHLHCIIPVHDTFLIREFRSAIGEWWETLTYREINREGLVKVRNLGRYATRSPQPSPGRPAREICSPVQLQNHASYIVRLAEPNDEYDVAYERDRLFGLAGIKRHYAQGRCEDAPRPPRYRPHEFWLGHKHLLCFLPSGRMIKRDDGQHEPLLRQLDQEIARALDTTGRI